MNKIYIRGNEIATKEYVDSLSFEGGNADLSNYYTKEEINNIISETNNSIQVEEMPEASEENVGTIVQYIGITNESYTTSNFYQVVEQTVINEDGSETTVYIWEEIIAPTSNFNEIIGDLENLNTEDKSNLVNAINEVMTNTGEVEVDIPVYSLISSARLDSASFNFNDILTELSNIVTNNLEKTVMVIVRSNNSYSYNYKKFCLLLLSYASPTSVLSNITSTVKGFTVDNGTGAISIVSFSTRHNNTVGAITFTSFSSSSTYADYLHSQNALSKYNTTAFNPTSDYHPATKKYVDDAVMNVGGSGDDYVPTFVLNTGSTTDIFVNGITISASAYPEMLQAFSEFLTKCYAEGHDIINIVLKTSNNRTLLFNMMTSSFQTKPAVAYIFALYFQNRELSPNNNNPLAIIQGGLRLTWDDNNVVTVNSFETYVQRNHLLTTKNTDAYTPTSDYHPATKKYVDDAITTSIAGISSTSMEIATSLPTENISTSTIYLVKDETASIDTENIYNEYIYINGAWENIGSTKTTVDLSKYSTTEELSQMLSTALSNYLTTADMNAALNNYYTKTATDEAIENAINNIEHPTTDLSNYYNKQEIDTMIGDINSILDAINGEEV